MFWFSLLCSDFDLYLNYFLLYLCLGLLLLLHSFFFLSVFYFNVLLLFFVTSSSLISDIFSSSIWLGTAGAFSPGFSSSPCCHYWLVSGGLLCLLPFLWLLRPEVVFVLRHFRISLRFLLPMRLTGPLPPVFSVGSLTLKVCNCIMESWLWSCWLYLLRCSSFLVLFLPLFVVAAVCLLELLCCNLKKTVLLGRCWTPVL